MGKIGPSLVDSLPGIHADAILISWEELIITAHGEFCQ
jgi:hypothetical protein